jgi:hypothetical protein
MTRKEKEQEKARCLDNLKKWLKDGDCLYMMTEYTRSGMTRYIRVFLPVARGDIDNLTYNVAFACGYPIKGRCGSWYLVVRGCGYSAVDSVLKSIMHKTGLNLNLRQI